MFLQNVLPMPMLYNQTDRIQGMARYMNADGASAEWFTLLTILLGMVLVVLLLKMFSAHKQKQREAELRQKMQHRKNAAKRAKAEQRTSLLQRTKRKRR